MTRNTYTTADHNERAVTGTYTVWPNGSTKEIEYTYPDGDPARWTSVTIIKTAADGTPLLWKGNSADLRPRFEDAVLDAIRRAECLAPRIRHTAS